MIMMIAMNTNMAMLGTTMTVVVREACVCVCGGGA